MTSHRRELIRAANPNAIKSDLIRHSAIAHLGGIYIDHDIEPLRPFDPLADSFLTQFTGGAAGDSMAFMGCTQHHPAVLGWIKHVEDHATPEGLAAMGDEAARQHTGARLMSEFYRGRWDTATLPSDLVCAAPSSMGYNKQAMAIHHKTREWGYQATGESRYDNSSS